MVEKISDDKTPKPAWTPPKGNKSCVGHDIYKKRRPFIFGRNEGA